MQTSHQICVISMWWHMPSQGEKWIDTICSPFKNLSPLKFPNAQGDPLYICFWFSATLGFHDECTGFQKPNKMVDNQSFNCLTSTASQCNRSIMVGILGTFTWLGNRYNCGFSPIRWKLPTLLYIVINL